MSFSYCTLFNINYIDKGIALYNSIRRYNEYSILYILCLDMKTENILNSLGMKKVILIKLSDIEKYYPHLIELKENRSFAEYCWTLTPHLIEYIFKKYNELYNTYLDSDIYFYSNPDVPNVEMLRAGCHTLITKHGFPNDVKGKMSEKLYGTYCVQYNTFSNEKESLDLLEIWKNNVIRDCEYNKREGKIGDQKYLEEFPRLSKSVYIAKIGVGIAPWNIKEFSSAIHNKECFIVSNEGEIYQMIFYHFQNLKYLSKNVVNIGVGKANRKLKRMIYIPYLYEINDIRGKLYDRYKIKIQSRSVSRKNWVAFIQKYLMKYKIVDWCLSDIISIK